MRTADDFQAISSPNYPEDFPAFLDFLGMQIFIDAPGFRAVELNFLDLELAANCRMRIAVDIGQGQLGKINFKHNKFKMV